MGGRGRIWEQVSQLHSKAVGLWVGLGWKDFSKRKKAVGDVVVTGRSLEPTEGQASLPKQKDRKGAVL